MDLDVFSAEMDEILDEDFFGDEQLEAEFRDATPDETFLHNLEMVPIVYTTRLDDMIFFQNAPPTHNTKEIIKEILRESKPKQPECIQNNISVPNKIKFIDLHKKLTKIFNANEHNDKRGCNMSVLNECKFIDPFSTGAKKTKLLLKKCPPCSIVLEALSKTNIARTQNKDKVVNLYLSDEDILLSSDEDEPLLNFKTREDPDYFPTIKEQQRANKYPSKKLTKPSYTFENLEFYEVNKNFICNGAVIMEDLYSNEMSLYLIGTFGCLIEYYTDVIGQEEKYTKGVKLKTTTRYKNCCWIRREENIKALYPTAVLHSNAKFMRKPHRCSWNKCVCCCRKEKLNPVYSQSNINDSPIPKINTKDWIQNLPKANDTNTSRSLISKAFQYSKPLPRRYYMHNDVYKSVKYNIVILRNQKKFQTMANSIEMYEFNLVGEFVSCIKSSSLLSPDSIIARQIVKSRGGNISKVICCWYNRERFLEDLIKDNALPPKAINFMRVNHMCKFVSCGCCCKPRNDKKQVLTTPIKLSSAFAIRETISKKMAKSSQFAPATSKKDSNTHQTKPTVSGTIQNVEHSNSKTPLSSRELPMSAEEDCQIVSVIPPKSQGSIPDQTNATVSNNLTSVIHNQELSDEINILITSILERFKDVRLTINSEGKVGAALNTSVHKLTTLELKVLADILSYAQSQVNSLGLTSGMNLNTVIDFRNAQNLDTSNINITNVNGDVGKSVDHQQTSSALAEESPPSAAQKETIDNFGKIMSFKSIEYKSSFMSFINRKTTVTPIIKNVFSLNSEAEKTSRLRQLLASTKEWYKTPDNCAVPDRDTSIDDTEIKPIVPPIETCNKNTNETEFKSDSVKNTKIKRKDDSTTPPIKRLRVLSPTKLGAPSISKTTKFVPTIYNSISEKPAAEVIPLGVPLLSNSNINFITITDSLNSGSSGIRTVPGDNNVLKPVLVVSSVPSSSEPLFYPVNNSKKPPETDLKIDETKTAEKAEKKSAEECILGV